MAGAEAVEVVQTEPMEEVGDLHPGGADRAWEGFAAAWVPLQERLFRIALLLTSNPTEAEDAVSEVMAATYGPWKAGRVESLDAYARRAVVNRVAGTGRRRLVADRHRRSRSGDDRGGRELADQVADRSALRSALSALPPRQRAVVVLRYYALLTVAETADTLGCSEGTVKSQTHDALAELRTRLGAADEEKP